MSRDTRTIHEVYKDAKAEGQKAGEQGKSIEECPYHVAEETALARWWVRGWRIGANFS